MKKSVTKNYLYNLSYQILILILPLITTPYISRVLKAHGVGIFSYTNSITQYFILFGAIGLNLYGQREIAYVQTNKVKYSQVFYEILITRMITLSISVLAFYFLLCHHDKYGIVFMIQTIDIIASIFDISWLFQGLEDFKKIVIRNFIVKIVGMILIFIFVKNVDDLKLYVFLNSITLLFGNLSMWLYLPKTINKIDLKTIAISRHIKPAIALFVPQIATSLYTMLDKTMIGFLSGNESEVAFYEQSQKIIKMALTFITSLGTVMMPRIAKTFAEDNHKKIRSYMALTFKIVFTMSIPLCLGIMAISPNFVPWFFGEGYDKVVPNMIIIAPIIILISLSNVTGTQFLLPTRRQREYTVSVVGGSIINIVFNFIFIPMFLSIGAAIATLFAELIVTLIQLYFVRYDFDLKKIISYAVKYSAYSIIMAICVYILGTQMKPTIITTVVQATVGISIYVGLLFITKDDMVYHIIDRLKIKIGHGNGENQ